MSNKEKMIWEPIKGLTGSEITKLARADLAAVYAKWVEIKGELGNTERLDAYLSELKRSWAIETGIIENLYTLSEGATKTLVEEGFKASLISRDDTNMEPAELVNVLRSHTDGIDFVMDIISGQRGLTVGTIKELHALVTKHQKTTKAIDPRGNLIEIPLVRGEYKQLPNDPTDAEGVTYVYCPPEQVAQEMERLVDYYDSFKEAPPEVISAFLHHRFTQIHPFQDGNGRVARYLANLVFIKKGYLPLVVTRNERAAYIKALEKANSGAEFSLRALIDFFAEIEKSTLIGAISLGQERLSAEKEIGTILDALREKRVEKAKARERRLKEVERRCLELSRRAADRLRTVAKEIEAEFKDVTTYVMVSDVGDTQGHFTPEIYTLKPEGWSIDLGAPAYWVWLHIETGRYAFDFVTNLINIGIPISGLIGVLGFYEVTYLRPDRLEGEHVDKTVDIGRPKQVGGSFTFTAEQPVQDIESGFEKWLNETTIEAIRIWGDSIS
jgi:Fic family protein